MRSRPILLATALALLAGLWPAPGKPEPHLDLPALVRGPCPVRITHHRGQVAVALCGIHRPTDFEGAFKMIEGLLAPEFTQGIRIDAGPDDRWSDVAQRVQLVEGTVLSHRLGFGAAHDPNPLWLDFGEYLPAPGCETTVLTLRPDGSLGLRAAGASPVRRYRHGIARDMAALPAALAALDTDRCSAVVVADGDRPWREVRPLFEALRAAGYGRFAAPGYEVPLRSA